MAQRVDAGDRAKRLGEAYRAYDRTTSPRRTKLLAKLDDAQARQRGLRAVAARHGRAAHAASRPPRRRAFEKLAKLSGSRFAREVPWRLADCAWADAAIAPARRRRTRS